MQQKNLYFLLKAGSFGLKYKFTLVPNLFFCDFLKSPILLLAAMDGVISNVVTWTLA